MDANNKRAFKNTIILYARMLIILAVNLVTTRLVLKAIGIEDYGIFQLVGGTVSLFTILNGALSSGSSRFITFALGEKDNVKLKKTFNTSFIIHLGMSIVILILLETVGLWYINTEMVAPDNRFFAINVVFQLSILTCLLSLTQVPYLSLITAHERMDIYAYIGLAEVFFKLLLVIMLIYVDNADKLILYASLLLLWNIIAQIYYRVFCYKHYPESHLEIVKDKALYKKMLTFSFWDVIGIFTVQGNGQLVNMFINSFFGLIYNASFGLTGQVSNIINQFINNFMTAVNPQITKYYAENNYTKAHNLIVNSSIISYLLYAAIAVPFFFEADYIVKLWLGTIPDKTVLFIQLSIIMYLIRASTRPIVTAVHATGNIKYLNIYPGLFSVLLTVPLTYVAFRFDFPIESTFYISIFVALVCNFIELFCLRREDAEFSISNYIYKVYFKISLIVAAAFLADYIFTRYFETSFLRVILTTIISSSIFAITVYLFILTDEHRSMIHTKIRSIISCKPNRQ